MGKSKSIRYGSLEFQNRNYRDISFDYEKDPEILLKKRKRKQFSKAWTLDTRSESFKDYLDQRKKRDEEIEEAILTNGRMRSLD